LSRYKKSEVFRRKCSGCRSSIDTSEDLEAIEKIALKGIAAGERYSEMGIKFVNL
jgi:hypothetical protein